MWNIDQLFEITDTEKSRISEIIAAFDTLTLVPGNTWRHTINVNDNHLRMWLITGKRDEDTKSDFIGHELPSFTMSNEKLLELWKIESAARAKITEIERCACTILMRSIGMIGQHPSATGDERIARWIIRLCTHANWYGWGPEGIHSNGSGKKNQFDYAAYWKGHKNIEHMVNYSRDCDDQLLHLGGAVASYRSDDRPGGDQATRLDNMSEVIVISSLAAAVAEFHAGMLYAMFLRFDDN